MPYDFAYLQRRLSERIAQPDRVDALDKEIWDQLGENRAILVSDMSGFTRLTKKRGILHFLAMHYQGVTLVTPVIGAHAGTPVKAEADNTISTYARPDQAARCAIAVQRSLSEHNATVADPDARIFFCIGIGYGRVLHMTDDIFGDEVNVAYKLGEDIAKAGEILVSESARDAIRAVTDEFQFGERLLITAGSAEIPYFRLNWD